MMLDLIRTLLNMEVGKTRTQLQDLDATQEALSQPIAERHG